jgi:hypothetical protein
VMTLSRRLRCRLPRPRGGFGSGPDCNGNTPLWQGCGSGSGRGARRGKQRGVEFQILGSVGVTDGIVGFLRRRRNTARCWRSHC